MDMINRYVYAVTKILSKKQREGVEKELRKHIDDMIKEQEGPENYESKVQKVLLELGDPQILAKKYGDSKRYLIGPQNYDKYLEVLKIVLIAVFIGISIAVIVGSIFSKNQNIVKIFSDYIAALFSGLLQGFAWTTIAFAIAEKNSSNLIVKNSKKAEWTLSQLPKVPEEKAVISPVESIVSILFSTIFIAILYFSPELFAAYIDNNNSVSIIPIFNLEVLKGYRILFMCIFVLSIFKEVSKLISRRWTLKLAILFSVLSVISTILMLIVFVNPNIWNPNFSAEIMKYTKMSFNFTDLWVRLTTGFIIVMIIACVFEISTALYKGIKYNVTK